MADVVCASRTLLVFSARVAYATRASDGYCRVQLIVPNIDQCGRIVAIGVDINFRLLGGGRMGVERHREGRSVLTFALIALLSGIISACDNQPETPGPDARVADSPDAAPNESESSGATTDEDEPSTTASAPSGIYARKAFWEHLPGANWSDALQEYNTYEVSAVNISNDGQVMAVLGWHEGYTPRGLEVKENGLWVNDSSGNQEGPFIRVGDYGNEEALYFGQIFGNRCFSSETKERWCFGAGTIQIAGKEHRARLALDLIETPTYGNSVTFEDDDKHFSELVIVPTKSGWKVYKDAGFDSPGDNAPWHVLTPE